MSCCVVVGCNKLCAIADSSAVSHTCRAAIKAYLSAMPLETPEYDIDLSHLHIVDIGDVGILPSLDDSSSWPLERVVTKLIELGALPILIDGLTETSALRPSLSFGNFAADVSSSYAAACGLIASAVAKGTENSLADSHSPPRQHRDLGNIGVLAVTSRVSGVHLQVRILIVV